MTTTSPPTVDRRLGRNFGRLWAAAAFSNLADGVGRTAVPLIATTLTRDPVAIAAVGALAFVPWLVFGIPAGLIVDRYDRRLVMAGANALRGGAALGLALLTAADALTLPMLLAGVLVFGLGETLFDNATNAVIPSLVPRRDLDRANGRIQAAQVTVDSFLAQPIAGLLFAVALALPLWAGAVAYVVPVVLALMLPLSAARAAAGPGEAPREVPVEEGVTRASNRAGIGEAARHLWRHRLLRGLSVFTALMGCAFSFAQAPTILYFLDAQNVPAAAVGFVTAGIGLGALSGSLVAARLVARFGRGAVMLGANIGAGLGLLAVWAAPNAVVAVLAYAALAFAISSWNVPWGAFRQAVVPGRLFGRVIGIIRTFTWGLFPVATLLGGVVARVDLRLPYLIAAGVTLVATAGAARLLLSATRAPATPVGD